VRIKARTGPVQLLLPLQMPLALGAEAFAERPAPAPVVDDDDAPVAPQRPSVDQRALW
jgi:hypothetical protein